MISSYYNVVSHIISNFIVQKLTLPLMNIIDETDKVSVFVERGEKTAVNTAEFPLKFLKAGKDVGFECTMDQSVSLPITMQRQMSGDYKVLITTLLLPTIKL